MNDRQRLEAIVAVVCKYLPPDGISREEAMSQIIGLVDPLPAQPEQEPVAYADPLDLVKDGNWDTFICKHASENHEGTRFKIPLFTAPASKPWIDLSDDEISSVWHKHLWDSPSPHKDFARAIEAALRSKNNG